MRGGAWEGHTYLNDQSGVGVCIQLAMWWCNLMKFEVFSATCTCGWMCVCVCVCDVECRLVSVLCNQIG